MKVRNPIDVRRSTRWMVLVVMAATLAGCHGRGQREAEHEHEAAPSAPTVGSIRACGSEPEPDLALKARKERIAKGVDRASRRIRVEGDLELWETPYGPYWVVEKNFDTMAEVLAEQAISIYGDEERGVHAGDVVLDGGAHFGGFTRTALARGAKLVVAIDIAPENVACLRRNFAPEIAAGRVIVYDKGIWDKDETMVLERKNHTWADQVAESGTGPTVRVTTIDRIVTELRLPKVDFIKMDIEGAERNALTGAADTISAYRPRMAIAAYHRPDDLAVLSSEVLSARSDYTTCIGGGGLGHGYTTLFFK